MVSDRTLSIIFNAIGSTLGWLAFGLGISSVVSIDWRRIGLVRYGLWQECILIPNLTSCTSTDGASYILATRAFMILFVIFAFLAGLVNVVSQWKLNKKAREGSGGIYSIAGTFAVVGAIIFTAVDNRGDHNGVGFAFAWTVVGLSYVAGIFQQLSARKMENY